MAKKKTPKRHSSGRSRVKRDGTDRPEYVPGYTWDAAAADRPITFIESFCRTTNDVGEPVNMRLMDWQKDRVLRPLFGWKKPNGRLRYRRGALFVPKKNGVLAPAA